jgi:tRNA nucleotidyltransferase/poly(A) polymerase
MMRPTIARLPRALALAVRHVAETLHAFGHRAWLVGGAVRDLALGREPVDADLASAALPDEVERAFPVTHAVGRAFGTVVVHCGPTDVQVTTFRAESGYEDARRPTHVRFSASLEDDAARRDFTCNALYLDPLSDEFRDPTGGIDDLAARRIRCVGEPMLRFGEDGLRLLRLARLAAEYELELDGATRAGALESLDALRGLSPERVFEELARMSEGAAPGRAVGLLAELGVLVRLTCLDVPGGPATLPERVAAIGRLEGSSRARFFALLFRPHAPDGSAAALTGFLGLRPSRELQQHVRRIWELADELGECLALLRAGGGRRARWIRLVRAEDFPDALAVWRAWHADELVAEQARLRALVSALTPAELRPVPLVTSADLARANVPRGPRWAELLRAAEDAQLDGELLTAEDARAWLALHAPGSSRREDPA